MPTFELMIGSWDDYAVFGTIETPPDVTWCFACSQMEALLVEYLQVHKTTAGFLKELNTRDGWSVEYRNE